MTNNVASKLNVLIILLTVQVSLSVYNQLQGEQANHSSISETTPRLKDSSLIADKQLLTTNDLSNNTHDINEFKRIATTENPSTFNKLLSNKVNEESRDTNIPPNWNCDLYQCGDKNQRIYPPAQSFIDAMKDLYNFTIKGDQHKDSTDMIIVYDVECPKCIKFHNSILPSLLRDGYNIRFVPSTFDDMKDVSDLRLRKFSFLMCSSDKLEALKKLHNSNYKPDSYTGACTKDKTLQVITNAKTALKTYGMERATPLIFTNKALMFGYRPYSALKKYL